MTPTDMALVEQWMERHDAEAFHEIVHRHSAMVYATCRRVLGNAADAEDVAQDCFLKLAQAHSPIRTSLAGWLHTLATHRSINRIRTDTRRREREIRYVTEENGDSPVSHTVDVWDEVGPFVDEAIAALPEKLRYPVIAYFLENRTHGAIARTLDLSQSAVTRRIQKGIEQVRKSLRRRGVLVGASALAAMLTANAVEAAPATLASALGKIALAGAGAQAGAGTIGTAGSTFRVLTALGGTLAMKKAIVGVAVVLAGLVALRAVTQREKPEPVEPVQSAEPSTLERASSAEPGPWLEPVPEPVVEQVPDGNVALTGDDAAVNKIEREGVSISGRVILPSGRPAADANVVAHMKERELRRYGLTDSDGTFELDGLSAGSDLGLYAEKDQLRSKLYGPIPLVKEGLQDFTIALLALGGIRGVVVDVEGRPVPGARVGASADEEPLPIPRIYTDDGGTFELTGLVPARYSFKLTAPDSKYASDHYTGSVQVHAGEVHENVTLVLDMGGELTIAGRVTDTEGDPIVKAWVNIWEGRREWTTETDTDGNYRLTGLSDITYGVTAYFTGYAHRTQWEVPAGSEAVDFALPRTQTTFKGHVVRADTGEPIPEFEVLVVPFALFDFQQIERWSFEPRQHPDGWFTVDDVVSSGAAWATILARAEGFATAYESVRTRLDATPVEAVLRLEHAAEVDGIVVNKADQPVPGAHIVVGPIEDLANLTLYTAAYSQADGTFAVSGVSSRTRVISAYHPTYAPGSAEVDLAPGQTRSVRIVLAEGGIVEGTVTSEGQSLEDVYVKLYRAGNEESSLLDTRTDSAGRFRFSGVTAGMVDVTAFFPLPQQGTTTSIRRLTHRTDVENRSASQVDFEFSSATGVIEGTVTFEGVAAREGHVRLEILSDLGQDFRVVDLENGMFRADQLSTGSAHLEIRAFFTDLRGVVRRKRLNVMLEDEPVEVAVDFAEGGRIGASVTGISPEEAYVDVFEGVVDVDDPVAWDARYDSLVWQGSVGDDGTFQVVGFDSGTYTVVVSASDKNADTVAEAEASFRGASAEVEVADGQEIWIGIPVR